MLNAVAPASLTKRLFFIILLNENSEAYRMVAERGQSQRSFSAQLVYSTGFAARNGFGYKQTGLG